MNENEIMVNEEIEENPEVEEETTNNGFGLGVIIGGLVTLGGIWVGKKVKNVIAKKKAKNSSSEQGDEIEVEDFEVGEDPESKK